MTRSSLRFLARAINRVLSPLGLRISQRHNDPEQFLPLSATVSAAKKAGLSVGDYVDITYNAKGATQGTIDQLESLGVFSDRIENALEIGPGSGRYAEKIMRRCSPAHYEIYETSEQWANYLKQELKVVLRPVDGMSLSSTPDSTIDLVQAYKVFVCTTFIVTCRYWEEMLRVAHPGAPIVFDIVTERCMDDETLKRWTANYAAHGNYPAIMPRQFAVDFFSNRGAALVGSFMVPMRPGHTETLVFKRARA
jgi:hypothetical protein